MLAQLARGWRAIPLLIKGSGVRQVYANLKLANYEHANQPLYINWFANLAMALRWRGGIGDSPTRHDLPEICMFKNNRKNFNPRPCLHRWDNNSGNRK